MGEASFRETEPVPGPAQGEVQWSGQSGASGDPRMTADAIRAAAADFPNCIAGLWREAERRGISRAAYQRFTAGLVPDLSILRTIERRDIEAIVDRSLRRLKTDRLDLVQFNWWDYSEPHWLEALGWLDDLRTKGKVCLIGGTNFDAPHVR